MFTREEIEKEYKNIVTTRTLIVSEFLNNHYELYHVAEYALGVNSCYFIVTKNKQIMSKFAGLQQAIDFYVKEREWYATIYRVKNHSLSMQNI